MKNRFPVGSTVIFLVVFTFLYFSVVIWISTILKQFEIVWGIGSVLFLVIFPELLSRLGPEKFDTLVSLFLSLNTKDRIVFLLASILSLGFIVVTGERIISLPIGPSLAYIGVAIVLFVLPTLLFGSQELRKKLSGKKK